MKTILITAILLSLLSGFALQPLFAQRIRVMSPSRAVMVYPHFRPSPVVIGPPVVVLPAPMPPVPPAVIYFNYCGSSCHCPHCHKYRNDCKRPLQQHPDPSPEDTNTHEKMPAGINVDKTYKKVAYTYNGLK